MVPGGCRMKRRCSRRKPLGDGLLEHPQYADRKTGVAGRCRRGAAERTPCKYRAVAARNELRRTQCDRPDSAPRFAPRDKQDRHLLARLEQPEENGDR